MSIGQVPSHVRGAQRIGRHSHVSGGHDAGFVDTMTIQKDFRETFISLVKKGKKLGDMIHLSASSLIPAVCSGPC